MLRGISIVAVLIVLAASSSCEQNDESLPAIRADVGELLAKFAPVDITTDISFLPASEQAALKKIIAASRYMDDIFLRQVYEKNPDSKTALSKRSDELGKQAYAYFNVSYGLWDRLDIHEKPFIGDMERPPGAGYYPLDMTKSEFDSFVENNAGLKESFTSEFTVIRRQNNDLVAVPYSDAYREWLQPAAGLLHEAAELTSNTSLQKYLNSRAEAFLSNDYFQSDMDWMDLESAVEVTIGPYEVYEDKLFGYKAAFESFVTVTDPEESEILTEYKSELPAMERNLPIPDKMKNLNRGTESPIRVVDVVYTAGDTRSGTQTIAFNLPNNETVREVKGSRKVLLRNVIAAKYQRILTPIARKLIDPAQLQFLTENAFTNEVLFHELSHGLGPGKIKIDGRDTEVRLELKELYSFCEEAKADIMGLYNFYHMIDEGYFDESMRKEIAVTYAAGLFRHVRFGLAEAHAKGAALQFNYMVEKGALIYNADSKTFAVNFDSFENWVRELLQDICILQATGDYNGTKGLVDKYVKIPDVLASSLEILEAIPVDIVPRYPLAEQLLTGTN